MDPCVITDMILAHRFLSPAGWVSDEYALARKHHGIVYVLEGRAEYSLTDGGSFWLQAGECLYMPKGVRYITRCGQETGFIHMTVNFDLLGNQALFSRPDHRALSQPQRFEQVFSSMVRTWAVRHPYYQDKCLSLLYELIYLLRCEVRSAPQQHLRRLSPAQAYLDEHFCEEFSLDLLPELCDLSPTYFRRLFHSVFHETAAEYRRRLRMAHACDLLLTGLYTVEEVAERCGYADPAYFCRIFTKVLGQPPSRYKKTLLETEQRP